MHDQLPHLNHWYDGQIRRYITQVIRMMSGFSYMDNTGNIIVAPVSYGDFSRQVASIMKDNSENKMLSTPRIGVYVTGLELDRNRLRDQTHVDKVNVRERKFDEQGNEYFDQEGKNYTVERLMPAPYKLTVNTDIWTSNLNQKLQILEQILMLFNPSLELQSNDNYFDWTSLTVVNLENITWSSRSIPEGTESSMDIATLEFGVPIWIATPAKVKRLGVIANIINRIHEGVEGMHEDLSGIDTTTPEFARDNESQIRFNEDGDLERIKTVKDAEKPENLLAFINTNFGNIDLLVFNDTMKIIKNGVEGGLSWKNFLEAFPIEFQPGLSHIKLKLSNWKYNIVGTFDINPDNEYEAFVEWDEDTLPTDTLLESSIDTRSNIDFIIDPKKTDPSELDLSSNTRIMILNDIGNKNNDQGPLGWKNTDNSDFIANENDIIEWNGTSWEIVFDASENTNKVIYTTNLNTGVQYRFTGQEWILSFEGEYPTGSFYVEF